MTARPEVRAEHRGIRVIKGTRSEQPRVGGWAVYSVVVALVFFGQIYSQTELDSSAFELKELDSQIAEAQAEQLELKLEVARLDSPARIVPAADELGMVLPTDRRAITAPGVVVSADDQPLSDPLVTASP